MDDIETIMEFEMSRIESGVYIVLLTTNGVNYAHGPFDEIEAIQYLTNWDREWFAHPDAEPATFKIVPVEWPCGV